MVNQVENLISKCDITLRQLRSIDPTSPWTGAGVPPIVCDYNRVKGWLEDLTYTASRLDVLDSPPLPPERLCGPGITKIRGIAMAIDFVIKVRCWGVSLLPIVNPLTAGSRRRDGIIASN
jgi:hypothetical protein